MVENGLSRRTVFAGVLAVFLFGIFILVNCFRSYRETHQTIDRLAEYERETLPSQLADSGRRLALHDFEWGNPVDTSTHLVFSGHDSRQSLKLNSWAPFSPGLWIQFKDLIPGDSLWIQATGYVWFDCAPAEVKCYLVATCNHKGINYKYMYVDLEKENLQPNQWNRVSIDYLVPKAPDPEDVVQAYFWFRGGGEILVDDVELTLFNLEFTPNSHI
jgi:hypothetical protein